ncbi:phosphatidylglycerophosphatase A family protein [Marimonas arenosa]|uniref:Phosphatidylglycerophosphatase A n=1 Tax=Marimonas arenosa TaxID=1795305 RepID=A0AAE4B519_9RHOB|nr:phosphatidylglycerophosphatase A [Marimonas arenosa]MDQ2088761.1 phosphatidylglycerophosphatase A [Marimonas arenosa]
MTRLIATFFYTGYLKPLSGTWGSAAAVVAAFLLYLLGGWLLVAILIPIAFVAGLWATARETAGKDNHDPSEIVIDEVAGQWIALLPVLIGASHAGYTGPDALALWPGWVTAFLAFRFFDILKPGPIGWADRQKGPIGVMLDDILAGIAAALVVGVFAYAAHGYPGA